MLIREGAQTRPVVARHDRKNAATRSTGAIFDPKFLASAAIILLIAQLAGVCSLLL